MRIFFGIAICVVHPVHHCIGTGIQKRGALCNECEKIKEALPEFVHGKHLMRCIPVQEKCLTEKRKKPMDEEKDRYCHFLPSRDGDGYCAVLLTIMTICIVPSLCQYTFSPPVRQVLYFLQGRILSAGFLY